MQGIESSLQNIDEYFGFDHIIKYNLLWLLLEIYEVNVIIILLRLKLPNLYLF